MNDGKKKNGLISVNYAFIIIDVNSKRITKSNAIVNASYRFSLNELRILLYGLSHIDPRAEEFPMFHRVRVKDLADFYDIGEKDRGSFYDNLKEALITKFWNREFSYYDEDRGEVVKRTFLIEVAHGRKDGTLAYEYNPKIKKELQQLSKRFTSYFLSNVAGMKSAYAVRIYEIAVMCLNASKKPKTTFSRTVEDLKHVLGISDKYKRFCDFKPRVLEAAKRDINKHSDIRMTYKVIKLGRSPHEIEFTVSRKPKLNQAPLALPAAPVVDEQDRTLPLVSTTAIEKGKEIVRQAGTGWDIYALIEQFKDYAAAKGRPDNPTGAFLGFVRKKVSLPPR